MTKASSKTFLLNTHDLPRRAGEMKEYQLNLDLDAPIGIDVIAVPKGILKLNLRLESVTEGVLATGDIQTVAKGECIRCLDPIELELDRNFQELYFYKADPEAEDQLLMDDVTDDFCAIFFTSLGEHSNRASCVFESRSTA